MELSEVNFTEEEKQKLTKEELQKEFLKVGLNEEQIEKLFSNTISFFIAGSRQDFIWFGSSRL